MQERQLSISSTRKQKSCAGHSSHTIGDNLIIYGRDIYHVKQEIRMQEGKLLLHSYSSYLS